MNAIATALLLCILQVTLLVLHSFLRRFTLSPTIQPHFQVAPARTCDGLIIAAPEIATVPQSLCQMARTSLPRKASRRAASKPSC